MATENPVPQKYTVSRAEILLVEKILTDVSKKEKKINWNSDEFANVLKEHKGFTHKTLINAIDLICNGLQIIIRTRTSNRENCPSEYILDPEWSLDDLQEYLRNPTLPP